MTITLFILSVLKFDPYYPFRYHYTVSNYEKTISFGRENRERIIQANKYYEPPFGSP